MKYQLPKLSSSLKPVPKGEVNSPPVLPKTATDNTSEDSVSGMEAGKDSPYVSDADSSPYLLSQAELNDLVCDLALTKEK